jgi:voltage-gated potassium channel
MRSELDERSRSVRRVFEVPIFLAALLVVPVILVEEVASSQRWLELASLANWAIWAVFVAEFVLVLCVARERLAWVRSAWLDLTIIVVSFPLLPSLFALTRLGRLVRLVRVLRVLRLVRLAAILSRGGLALRALSRKRGLGYLVGLTLLLPLGFGALFLLVEPSVHRWSDGFWWAFATLTTVGYGDIVATTAAARFVGVLLMLIGVALLAVLTGTIAAHFVEEGGRHELARELRQVHERLDRLDQVLAQLLGEAGSRLDERDDVDGTDAGEGSEGPPGAP